MNYTKPEVAVLGEAVNVIEVVIKRGALTDGPLNQKFSVDPAYDLDE